MQEQCGTNHVHMFAMGGTIDKDYPRLTSGYAFEFGDECAASRIMKSHPNLGVTFDVTSVCTKDSLDIEDNDREILVNALKTRFQKYGIGQKDQFSVFRVVVTHGTDTMIETALFVRSRLDEILPSSSGIVIAFTGATKPERFVDSDASFNLGCAVGATSICPPRSVVICMNGNYIPCERCVRGEESGLFELKS
mmetsp:Transcript_4752/g.9380  ORF Transcript_4752/g.9380 Transcript_4752/m.9380 type:complete len:194 (+) Transcript_4752:2-583(+)